MFLLVFLLRFQMMIHLVGVSPFSSHYVGAIRVNAVGGSNIFEQPFLIGGSTMGRALDDSRNSLIFSSWPFLIGGSKTGRVFSSRPFLNGGSTMGRALDDSRNSPIFSSWPFLIGGSKMGRAHDSRNIDESFSV